MDDFKDIYSREPFANMLLSVIGNLRSPVSIAVDGKWGSGKSTFFNRIFNPMAEKEGYSVITYDCFEHERESDPFVSLCQEILTKAQEFAPPNDIASVSKKAAKIAMGVGSVLAAALSRHLLRQSIEEATDRIKDFDSEKVSDELLKFVEDKLQHGQQVKKLKESFCQELSSLLSQKEGDNKTLILVIDELDRCKPSHAIDVLESIKHLLQTEGLVFVFSVHKLQLETMLKHCYGSGLDANLYLQKFFNVEFALPGRSLFDVRTKGHEVLFIKTLERFSAKKNVHTFVEQFQSFYAPFGRFYELTARNIEQCILCHMVLCDSSSDSCFDRSTIALLVIWKVIYPNELKIFGSVPDASGAINVAVATVKYYELLDTIKHYRGMATTLEQDLAFIFGGDKSRLPASEPTLRDWVNWISNLSV